MQLKLVKTLVSIQALGRKEKKPKKGYCVPGVEAHECVSGQSASKLLLCR